jgi:hypothetical protein
VAVKVTSQELVIHSQWRVARIMTRRVLKNHVMGLNVMIIGSYDMTTAP